MRADFVAMAFNVVAENYSQKAIASDLQGAPTKHIIFSGELLNLSQLNYPERSASCEKKWK